MMRRALIAAFVGAALLSGNATARASLVYSNDFSTSAGSEWSDNTIASSNGEKFLGSSAFGFGPGPVTLSLSGLSAHSQVTVDFDLYIIQSWDGNGAYGPDKWSLDANSNNLIVTSFANYTGFGAQQDYDTTNPTGPGAFAAKSGNTGMGHLGFGTGDFGDTTYHFSLTFADSASALALTFTGMENQSPGDEGWGLDNVTVSTNAVSSVPEPSSMALLGLGGIGAAFGAYRRRRAAV